MSFSGYYGSRQGNARAPLARCSHKLNLLETISKGAKVAPLYPFMQIAQIGQNILVKSF